MKSGSQIFLDRHCVPDGPVKTAIAKLLMWVNACACFGSVVPTGKQREQTAWQVLACGGHASGVSMTSSHMQAFHNVLKPPSCAQRQHFLLMKRNIYQPGKEYEVLTVVDDLAVRKLQGLKQTTAVFPACRNPLPPLFMRFTIQTLNAAPRLKGFVLDILSNLVNKQVLPPLLSSLFLSTFFLSFLHSALALLLPSAPSSALFIALTLCAYQSSCLPDFASFACTHPINVG